MSFIKSFQQEKEKIKNLVTRLYNDEILDQKEYKEIVDELKNDIIKIAVIGQMKYGKSTFINTFLFHSNYLPTSSTPMTAALSEIKYGEEEKYEVHFFTKEEFEELKEKEEFKDILEKAKNIPDKDSLFNTIKIISKDEFENYVGADGLYTPIVKMLTIYSPNEVLKEAIVVDTPGFNDPIESREKIAEKFIKNADFVILFLYAHKPFDAVDREIIIEKLQYLGKVGKVLIVVNKADLLLNEYGTMDAVTDYIKKTLENTIEDYIFSEALAETLREAEIIPISSLMALLARIDEEELDKNEYLSKFYEKFQSDFNIDNRKTLEEISNIQKLEKIIQDSLKEEKLKILISALKSKIIANISRKKQNVEIQLQQNKLEEKLTSIQDIREYQEKLNRFKSIEFKEKIYPILGKIERETKQLLDDKLVSIKNDIYNEIEEVKDLLIEKDDGKEELKYFFSTLLVQYNMEFKDKIKKLILSFVSNYKKDVNNTINKIFNIFRESDFVHEFELNNTVLENIKDNLLNISRYELEKLVDVIEIEIPEVDTGFFGDSKSEIKKQFKKTFNKYRSDALSLLDGYMRQFLELVERAYSKKIEKGIIIREFDRSIIAPIDRSLKEKELELQNIKEKIEEDNKIEMEALKAKLDAAKKFVEEELK